MGNEKTSVIYLYNILSNLEKKAWTGYKDITNYTDSKNMLYILYNILI